MIPAIFFTFLASTIIIVAGENHVPSAPLTQDIVSTTSGVKVNTEVFNSSTDGLHLWNIKFTNSRNRSFGQRLRLQTRNYHLENIAFNNTICVSALQWYWHRSGERLIAMFSVELWDSARPLSASMVMNFSYDNKSNGFNVMHSTHFKGEEDKDPEDRKQHESEEDEEEKEKKKKEPVYDLPPPEWRFLYVHNDCAVVQVLNHPSGAEARSNAASDAKQQLFQNCEVWDIYDKNESTKCQEYFKCYCDASNATSVNRADLCWAPYRGSDDDEEEGEEEEDEEEEAEEQEEDDEVESEPDGVAEEEGEEEAVRNKGGENDEQKGGQEIGD